MTIKTWKERIVTPTVKLPHLFEVMQDEIDELRAELERIKSQKPCAAMPRCNVEGAGICKCEDDHCNDLVDVYLAPGAAPLTRHQVNGLLESAGYVEPQERADFINGIRHCEGAHGIIAMLEAAKS